MTNTKETVLRVQGMTCRSCARHVDGALREVAGVCRVDVRLDAGEVRVEHDPAQAQLGAMISALEEAGYTARAA